MAAFFVFPEKGFQFVTLLNPNKLECNQLGADVPRLIAAQFLD